MKKFCSFLWSALMILCLLAGCGNEVSPSVSTEDPSAPYQFRSGDLEKYTIVYDGENPDYFDLAYRLNEQIYNKYGKIVPSTRDTNSQPGTYEILLGDTNRDDHTGRVMEYSVTVDNGKFRINAGGSFSAEKAVEFLCEQVFNGQEFALDNGEYYQTSLMTAAQGIDDGATRIMTANVLADVFADSSYQKAHYRAELFAGMLVSYTPDVVGLQETDENWNAVLDGYLAKIEQTHGIAYARHLATWQDRVNYTSLLYRRDKFQVLNSDVNVFTWWNDRNFRHNYHMRNISWAQFASLEDAGKTFVVANTHWSYRTEHANGNTYLADSQAPIATDELRQQCKDETNAFMSSLRQTYPDVPIFMTGDFNTSLPFFTESGWTPNGFRLLSEEALSSGAALSLVPESGYYDHLFGAGSYTIRLYGFFNDTNHHSLLTDHPFAYADLTF